MKNIISAMFQNNFKSYYFRNILEDIKVGDYVVVEAAGGFHVVLVNKIIEEEDTIDYRLILGKATKFTIDKVDFNLFDQIKEKQDNEYLETKEFNQIED